MLIKRDVLHNRPCIGGCLPDPPRDSSVKTILDVPLNIEGQSTTLDVDNRPYFLEISQQRAWPSCTANSGADLWEATCVHKAVIHQGVSLEQAKAATPNGSRMFLWWNARNEMSPSRAKDPTSGSYNRLILDVLSRHGIAKESLWPYDDEPSNAKKEPRTVVRPSILAYQDAFRRRTNGYYAITDAGDARVDRIIQTLRVLPGVMFATQVTEALNDIGEEVAQPPVAGGGGHSMVVVAWSQKKQAFLVRNSWGVGCGMGGYFWMSADYVAWERTGACWAMTL